MNGAGIRLIAYRLAGAFLLIILVFPRFDIVSAVGVDNSLAWAFNHFFSTGLDQASHIIFPHGPLAFLMYPQALGGDLDAAFFGTVAILGTFFFSLLSLGSDQDRSAWHFLLAAMLGVIVQPQMQFVGIVAAGLMLHWTTRSTAWLAVAVIAALIALHVRAGVGIIACTLLFAHAVILIWKRREWRTVGITLLGFILGAIVLRSVLYGSLVGFGTYYIGLFELARASSAATGLHPDNDWSVLGVAILLFIALPIVYKDARLRYAFALFSLALFASWKHGITREDIYHARGLFIFIALFFGLLLLVWRSPRPMALLAMATVLILGYRALASTLLYEELVVAPVGVQRYHEWAFDRDTMTQRALEVSTRNLAVQQLPKELVDRLNSGSVDVYPWEFSYIPANGLHWKPRPVLQSYASYTPWLDGHNADFFRDRYGADRILWHFNADKWGGRMGSVDDRYLLNDEPRTILAILDQYKWTAGTDRVAVLERTAEHQLGDTRTVGSSVETWDEWIDVPKAANGILRAKVDVQGTLWRALKDFVYKDAVYSVLYRLADGRTLSYRIVPDLAIEGIWVAPFIQHPEHSKIEQEVVAIRFQCSEMAMVSRDLAIEWELTALSNDAEVKNAFGLFGKVDIDGDTATVSVLDMETTSANWEWSASNRTDSIAHSGRHSHLLVPEAFSPTYIHPMDSLTEPFHVRAAAWVRAPKDAKLVLAIAVEDTLGAISWEAVDVQDMLFDEQEWWRVVIEREVQPGPGRKLKVYVWNTGELPALLDDLSVEIVPAH
ncbi:MAG: hypothetical protein IPO87_05630 [Flavobacteriales bacterium]|nr:hypothetical protein [Flavobacteriales bacterium]